MFSPVLQDAGPAKGTRSSRRRQRPLSNDSSMQQPKAKRQRVPLAETTFVNPEAPPEMYEVKADKIDVSSLKRDGIEPVAAPRKELSVRSKKPKPERASKGDGSVVLVRHLPPFLLPSDVPPTNPRPPDPKQCLQREQAARPPG